MKCPECQTENPETRKFCRECGAKLLIICPQCDFENLPEDKFCGECGQRLEELPEIEKAVKEIVSERKHVTVLFSDVSGYTAMTERLDPEEVKEIMSRIFGEIAQVITKYEGFIERFVGDAVMAIFGVPKVHEDDPVRAIMVAREIHDLVEAMSPRFEKKVCQTLSMHSGINTGLVVTGEVNVEKGAHGITGDAINLASRLSSLANEGEILVGPETHRRAEGHFTFESLEPTTVKGKAEPIRVHKVLSAKEKPVTIHRLSGLRADLIGRKEEIAQLAEAVENLRRGRGGIFSITGDAGTGKSRLVEEYKATLDLEEIQWLEGHAYAYSQNIPYFPLIDLLNRAFRIEESDPPKEVREKIESEIEDLVGRKEGVVPYIGGLFSLKYPELDDVSPEFWKSQLRDAVQTILSALARRAPTVFCLEDLHWADPSFLESLRHALRQIQHPAIVLCIYRPTFSLFTSHQLSGMVKVYQEIRLHDLSTSEVQDMLESLLKTETIPTDLRRFVQDKAEGNPFYLEELVNSLIESEILVSDDGNWRLTGPIREADVSSTIHGIISGRLDRLEQETKRVLQEASVIGRTFYYEILSKITELKANVDQCLSNLERLDLIKAKSLEPDLEYIFKHALTQEVVYNGLLKTERNGIHERIALVMEQLFHDRLPEFYETLAFHFSRGKSLLKAVEYLMKSGEKSLKHYAVEESHQYYEEAFGLLNKKIDTSKEENKVLIDLLIQWAYVFFYRGDFRSLNDLFTTHKGLAESLDDDAKLGMFYGWLGFSLYLREKLEDSYQILSKAYELGEQTENLKVMGYACAWLTWPCAELGLLEQGIRFGKKALGIARTLEFDHHLFFQCLSGMGEIYFYGGESKESIDHGRILLNYGKKYSNLRSFVMGHLCVGNGYFIAGDLLSAIESYKRAIKLSVDPFYSQWVTLFLGMSKLGNGEFQEAEEILSGVVSFSENFGCECIGTPALGLLGFALIGKGLMSRGIRIMEEAIQSFAQNRRRPLIAFGAYYRGKLYSQLAEGAEQISLAIMAKNIRFLVKNVPFATKKAEAHFDEAIEMAKEIGAKGVLGRAYLDLGLLHKAKKRTERAKECISKSIQIFEQCEAEIYLKQAREALE